MVLDVMFLSCYQVKVVPMAQAEWHILTKHWSHLDKVVHTNISIVIIFNLTEIDRGRCCCMLYMTLVVHSSKCLIANRIQPLADSCSVQKSTKRIRTWYTTSEPDPWVFRPQYNTDHVSGIYHCVKSLYSLSKGIKMKTQINFQPIYNWRVAEIITLLAGII